MAFDHFIDNKGSAYESFLLFRFPCFIFPFYNTTLFTVKFIALNTQVSQILEIEFRTALLAFLCFHCFTQKLLRFRARCQLHWRVQSRVFDIDIATFLHEALENLQLTCSCSLMDCVVAIHVDVCDCNVAFEQSPDNPVVAFVTRPMEWRVSAC